MKKKNVFVIGMGRFGSAAAANLHDHEIDVTIIDESEKLIKRANDYRNYSGAMVIDTTNIDALKSTNINSADHVIVAIGSVDASITTCVNLKDLGIKKITAKVNNKIHWRVLQAIGIPNIVFPESESAIVTSEQVIFDDVKILFKGDQLTMIMVPVKSENIIDQTPRLIENENFKIVAIKGNSINDVFDFNISDVSFKKLDKLIIMCRNNYLKKLVELFKTHN